MAMMGARERGGWGAPVGYLQSVNLVEDFVSKGAERFTLLVPHVGVIDQRWKWRLHDEWLRVATDQPKG